MCTKLYLSTTALLLLVVLPYASVTAARTSRGNPEEIPSEHRFNFFDTELLQSVANANSGNVLVSPASVKSVLGMILEAAGGSSNEQIRTALRLPENQEAIRRVFLNYLTSLVRDSSPGIKIKMASRVYMASNLKPSPGYVRVLQDHYYADLVKVNFTTPDYTARIINDWVKDATRGLIPKLVESGSIPPDAEAVIANTIYFKGKWKIPFEPSVTTPKCFYTSTDICQYTNMMETLEYFNYNYIQELDADAVELPYEGNKFSMLILAPKQVEGMTQLKRDILHFPLHSIVSRLEPTEVLVSLPRFEIEFGTDLVATLSGLGIKDIFGLQSNLTGLFARSETSAHISNVFHKTKIVVNEEGSESAAGTGALVIPLMGSTISKFRADRPFLFFIRDATTGITLFSGRVSRPQIVSPPYQRPQTPTSTLSPIDLENLQQSIFTEKYGSTLRPSHSNLGSGQNSRPSATTSRRPPLHHRPQGKPTGTTSTTTEGREINSFSNQNNPIPQNLQIQNSNVYYPDVVQTYKPSNSQNSNTQNRSPQLEGNVQNYNSQVPLTPTNSNAQNSFNSQSSNTQQQTSSYNSNPQYSQGINLQYNQQNIPLQRKSSSESVSRPVISQQSAPVFQYPSDTQRNAQNQPVQPQYVPISQNTNTQYVSPINAQQSVSQYSFGTQNTDRQPQYISEVRDNPIPQVSSYMHVINDKNSYPTKTINRETPQYSNIQNTQQSSAPYHPVPLFTQYHLPGNTDAFLTSNRESLQGSSLQSPTYSAVVRNESPLQSPNSKQGYQQPQSADKDAILFSSVPTSK